MPKGTFFLSIGESGHYSIWAYSPESLPLVCLTNDPWDDISPSLSPDGTKLAYSSNQNGYWDLFLMDLTSGKTSRVTNTPDFDGDPSWSPDGAYLAFETYRNGNLAITLQSVEDGSQVFDLTDDTFSNISPAWSPRGRQIAFISNRTGEPEVWLADLDKSGSGKFTDISQAPHTVEAHPSWSPDGSKLAWASEDPATGLSSIYVWDAENPKVPARWVGSGDWPVWQDNSHLNSRVSAPNQTYITGYGTDGTITLPPFLLPGPLNGLTFGVPSSQLPGVFQAITRMTPSPLFDSTITQVPVTIPGRSSLVEVKDIHAPDPRLIEYAYNSFEALRARIAAETGWDSLASLDNAYVPLTTPLEPELEQDWLYTGRAVTLNPTMIQAKSMQVVREDFGQHTYWHIFLRTVAQDGSEGAPMTQVPWDFSARTGDAASYENGGRLASSIPSGYWIDLTDLAIQYGWERMPATIDWQTYYAGARFNELVFTEGLDWQTAMLQLYPPEALMTPTIVIPPTRTPTRTPMWYQSPTSTMTPTHRPTNTPTR